MRYLVFAYNAYYPSGGVNDIVDFIHDINDVHKVVDKLEYGMDYYRVLDVKTKLVYKVSDGVISEPFKRIRGGRR